MPTVTGWIGLLVLGVLAVLVLHHYGYDVAPMIARGVREMESLLDRPLLGG